jgi:hypothetical protein
MAKLVAPVSAMAWTRLPGVSGARKPIRTVPGLSRPISSSVGAATLTTRSAAHTSAGSSTNRAPASSNCWSGISAPAPAPRWTRISVGAGAESPGGWVSFWTTSGTSATRHSPSATSLGTPIRMRRVRLPESRQPSPTGASTRASTSPRYPITEPAEPARGLVRWWRVRRACRRCVLRLPRRLDARPGRVSRVEWLAALAVAGAGAARGSGLPARAMAAWAVTQTGV